jgi:undecaprenyl-diphosphatase
MQLDQSVLDGVVAERTPWLIDVVDVITTAGGTAAVALAALAVVSALLWHRRSRDAVFVAVTMLTGWMLMSTAKNIVARERPPQPDRLITISSYSFPSGHAMMSAILATVLAVLVVRAVSVGVLRTAALVVLILYSVLVGLSRIYLAAHWTTDVLAGWAFGIGWALVLARLFTMLPATGPGVGAAPRRTRSSA